MPKIKDKDKVKDDIINEYEYENKSEEEEEEDDENDGDDDYIWQNIKKFFDCNLFLKVRQEDREKMEKELDNELEKNLKEKYEILKKIPEFKKAEDKLKELDNKIKERKKENEKLRKEIDDIKKKRENEERLKKELDNKIKERKKENEKLRKELENKLKEKDNENKRNNITLAFNLLNKLPLMDVKTLTSNLLPETQIDAMNDFLKSANRNIQCLSQKLNISEKDLCDICNKINIEYNTQAVKRRRRNI